jgi:uncharacterized protein (DUF2141 family)
LLKLKHRIKPSTTSKNIKPGTISPNRRGDYLASFIQQGNHSLRTFRLAGWFPARVPAPRNQYDAIEIRDTEARCDFLGIPAGTYALVVIHDENRNGKLDTNWLGRPTEGYAFSSDAEATLSAPSFSDASLRYDGGTLDLTISLHY